MIMDKLTQFCSASATGNTSTGRLIGDVIDLGATAGDIGNGQPVYLYVVVDTGIAAGGAGAFAVKLTTSSAADLATAPVDVVTGPSFVTGTTSAAGTLKAGTVLLQVALPVEGTAYARYLGIREVVTTENTTAGKITAFLSASPIGWKSYPQGQV